MNRIAERSESLAAAARRPSRDWIAIAITASVLLAYMPFLGRASATSDAISGSRVGEVLFLGTAMVGSIFLRGRNVYRAHAIPSFLLLAVVSVFALWAMITSLTGPLVTTGLIKSIELLALCGIAREITLSTQTSGQARRSRITTVLLIGILGILGILVISNILQVGEALPMADDADWPNTNGRPRLLLGTNHPLSSALLLSFGVIICLQADWSWIWRLPILIALEWLLHLCNARGIEAGCAVGVIISILQRMPRSPYKILVVLLGFGAIMLMVGSLLLSGDLSQIVSHDVGEDAWSLDSRVPLWAYILARVPDHPIMGVGYYSTRSFVLVAFPFAGQAHNSAIEVLFSTGFVGEFFFILFLGLWAYTLVTTRDPLLASISPIVVIEGSLDQILYTPGFGMFVMLVILLNALSLIDERTVRRSHEGRMSPRVIATSQDNEDASVSN